MSSLQLSSPRRTDKCWVHSKYKCYSISARNQKKNDFFLSLRKYQEQITSQYDDVGMRCERDAFDTLFDCAPEKLAVVKKVCVFIRFTRLGISVNRSLFLNFQSLVTFVNKHLNKLNIEVANLSTDFKDGVYLCLLMGLLGGFFVPLYDFHLTPRDSDQMVNEFIVT